MYVEHPYKFNDKYYAKMMENFMRLQETLPRQCFLLTGMKSTEAVNGSQRIRRI